MNRVRRELTGDRAVLWVTVIACLLTDALDIFVSYVDSAVLPIWSESNVLSRDPVTHAFWLWPSILLHAEFWLLYLLPFFYLLHRALRTCLKPKVAALLVSLPLWYEMWRSLQALVGNVAVFAFYLIWLKP